MQFIDSSCNFDIFPQAKSGADYSSNSLHRTGLGAYSWYHHTVDISEVPYVPVPRAHKNGRLE